MSDIGCGGAAPLEWKTALDIDFRAEPTQTLAPNGNYTIGGFTFTKQNSANENANMVLTNGVGIVITPKQATDRWHAVRTLPLLTIPITNVIADVDATTRIRFWLYIAAGNFTASWDACDMCIENASTSTALGAVKAFEGGGVDYQCKSTYAGNSLGVGGVQPSAKVVMLETLDGMAAGAAVVYAHADYPFNPASLLCIGYVARGAANVVSLSSWGLPSAWAFSFGSFRSGSGTALVVTVGAMRVDYVKF